MKPENNIIDTIIQDCSETAQQIVALATNLGLHLGVAESCTGGKISAAITSVSGSSTIFECGIVSYSNAAKTKLLSVPKDIIEAHGAVSEEVAMAMLNGIAEVCQTELAISTTGIAGPGGGTPQKPVGTVYIGVKVASLVEVQKYLFNGTRHEVQLRTVLAALTTLLRLLRKLAD